MRTAALAVRLVQQQRRGDRHVERADRAVHGNARRLVNARACAAGSSDRIAATLNGQAALRWLARRRCVSLLRSNGSNGRWPPFARRGSKGCMRSATVPSSTPPTVPRELDFSLLRELKRVVDLDP